MRFNIIFGVMLCVILLNGYALYTNYKWRKATDKLPLFKQMRENVNRAKSEGRAQASENMPEARTSSAIGRIIPTGIVISVIMLAASLPIGNHGSHDTDKIEISCTGKQFSTIASKKDVL